MLHFVFIFAGGHDGTAPYKKNTQENMRPNGEITNWK